MSSEQRLRRYFFFVKSRIVQDGFISLDTSDTLALSLLEGDNGKVLFLEFESFHPFPDPSEQKQSNETRSKQFQRKVIPKQSGSPLLWDLFI